MLVYQRVFWVFYYPPFFLILLLDIPQSLMLRGSSGSGCPMRSREASPLVRRPNDHDEKIREAYGKHMENIWKTYGKHMENIWKIWDVMEIK